MILRRICFLLSAMFLIAALSACGPTMHSKTGTSTTVILIRHAEKDAKSNLSPEGHARARALVEAVGHMNVQEIYSPNLVRNIDTVKPLAKHAGVDITLTPKISLPMVGKYCKEILTVHAGKVVLWVGNVSGNLQSIYHKLGGKGTGPIEYRQLFILTVPDKGPTRVEKTTFGDI